MHRGLAHRGIIRSLVGLHRGEIAAGITDDPAGSGGFFSGGIDEVTGPLVGRLEGSAPGPERFGVDALQERRADAIKARLQLARYSFARGEVDALGLRQHAINEVTAEVAGIHRLAGLGMAIEPGPQAKEFLAPVEVRVHQPAVFATARHELVEVGERRGPAARDVDRMEGEQNDDGPPHPRG